MHSDPVFCVRRKLGAWPNQSRRPEVEGKHDGRVQRRKVQSRDRLVVKVWHWTQHSRAVVLQRCLFEVCHDVAHLFTDLLQCTPNNRLLAAHAQRGKANPRERTFLAHVDLVLQQFHQEQRRFGIAHAVLCDFPKLLCVVAVHVGKHLLVRQVELVLLSVFFKVMRHDVRKLVRIQLEVFLQVHEHAQVGKACVLPRVGQQLPNLARLKLDVLKANFKRWHPSAVEEALHVGGVFASLRPKKRVGSQVEVLNLAENQPLQRDFNQRVCIQEKQLAHLVLP